MLVHVGKHRSSFTRESQLKSGERAPERGYMCFVIYRQDSRPRRGAHGCCRHGKGGPTAPKRAQCGAYQALQCQGANPQEGNTHSCLEALTGGVQQKRHTGVIAELQELNETPGKGERLLVCRPIRQRKMQSPRSRRIEIATRVEDCEENSLLYIV